MKESDIVINYNKYKYLINKEDINKNRDMIYRDILLRQQNLTIVFNNNNSSSLEINANISYGRIIQLAQVFPQEYVYFELNKNESSHSSVNANKTNSEDINLKLANDNNILINKNINEELLPKYRQKFSYLDKSISKAIKKNITEREKFFYYYIILLYVLYLIAGICLFVYILSLIIRFKCGVASLYLWTGFLLIVAMLFLGYIGTVKLNQEDLDENEVQLYNHDNIFWFHFIVLLLTITNFIYLIKEHYLDIKGEKYIGILVILLYIILLLFEIIGLLFFDLTNRIYYLNISNSYKSFGTNEENEKLLNV